MYLLYQILERVKNLSGHVTVRGGWSGELTLSVQTELVTTKTHFTDLDIPQLEDQVRSSERIKIRSFGDSRKYRNEFYQISEVTV